MLTALIGILFAFAGLAMGIGCWYAYRGLHPRPAEPDATAHEPASRTP